jgi:hypothetical protein
MASTLVFSVLRWLVKVKWWFMNSGEHIGNGLAQGGFSYGTRYDFSHVVIGANETWSPPEDPFCTFIPKVVPGGRVLHVHLHEGENLRSLQDYISRDAYTLVNSSKNGVECASIVEALKMAFASLGAPLSIVDLSEALRAPRVGKRNEYAASLWQEQMLVLCRPDLIVSWTWSNWKRKHGANFTHNHADLVARTLCGQGYVGNDAALSVGSYLSWLMLEAMKPLGFLFPQSVLVRGQVKDAEKNSLLVQGTKAQVVVSSAQPKREDNICPVCSSALIDDECIFLNNVGLHPECLASYRKQVGVQDKMCSFCGGMLLLSQGTTLNGNIRVHDLCMQDFLDFKRGVEGATFNY